MMSSRLRLAGMPALAAACLCGCALRGNTELLESRLRQQEDRMVRLEAQLRTTESELTAARGESQHLREQLAGRGEPAILPEQANAMFRATGVQFNRLLTGGLDRDGSPGDELLSAVVVPHDADGELVKLPGRIELQAFDLAMNGNQKLIGRWQFGVDECRTLWHSGFLGSGYLIRVPWIETPRSSRILLHARLVTTDGRQFDTSEHVEVTPPPASGRSKIVQTGEAEPPAENRPVPDDPEWDAEPELVPPKGAGKPAPPSEEPVRTSDRWTNDSIPLLR